MSYFNIGDKVVCVYKDEYNWYKIGSEFTIRSAPFVDTQDNTVCYHIKEEPRDSVWIQGSQFKLTKEEPKQMKATDKITVEITLAELAKIYAVLGKCSGHKCSDLYSLAQKTFDVENKRLKFMNDIEGADVLKYHNYEDEFLKLMFPEPPKKSKEQIKIEELQSTIDKAARELKELLEMGEKE